MALPRKRVPLAALQETAEFKPTGDVENFGTMGKNFEATLLKAFDLLGMPYETQRGASGELWDMHPVGAGWHNLIKDRNVNIKIKSTRWLFSAADVYKAMKAGAHQVRSGTWTPAQAAARVERAVRDVFRHKGVSSTAFMKPKSKSINDAITQAVAKKDTKKLADLLVARNFTSKRLGNNYSISIEVDWAGHDCEKDVKCAGSSDRKGSWQHGAKIRIEGGVSGAPFSIITEIKWGRDSRRMGPSGPAVTPMVIFRDAAVTKVGPPHRASDGTNIKETIVEARGGPNEEQLGSELSRSNSRSSNVVGTAFMELIIDDPDAATYAEDTRWKTLSAAHKKLVDDAVKGLRAMHTTYNALNKIADVAKGYDYQKQENGVRAIKLLDQARDTWDALVPKLKGVLSAGSQYFKDALAVAPLFSKHSGAIGYLRYEIVQAGPDAINWSNILYGPSVAYDSAAATATAHSRRPAVEQDRRAWWEDTVYGEAMGISGTGESGQSDANYDMLSKVAQSLARIVILVPRWEAVMESAAKTVGAAKAVTGARVSYASLEKFKPSKRAAVSQDTTALGAATVLRWAQANLPKPKPQEMHKTLVDAQKSGKELTAKLKAASKALDHAWRLGSDAGTRGSGWPDLLTDAPAFNRKVSEYHSAISDVINAFDHLPNFAENVIERLYGLPLPADPDTSEGRVLLALKRLYQSMSTRVWRLVAKNLSEIKAKRADVLDSVRKADSEHAAFAAGKEVSKLAGRPGYWQSQATVGARNMRILIDTLLRGDPVVSTGIAFKDFSARVQIAFDLLPYAHQTLALTTVMNSSPLMFDLKKVGPWDIKLQIPAEFSERARYYTGTDDTVLWNMMWNMKRRVEALVEMAKTALQHYHRAGVSDRVLAGPIIIRVRAPKNKDWTAGFYQHTGSGNNAVVVYADHIGMTPESNDLSLEFGTEILIHELAHRVYYRGLSTNARNTWHKLIAQMGLPLTKKQILIFSMIAIEKAESHRDKEQLVAAIDKAGLTYGVGARADRRAVPKDDEEIARIFWQWYEGRWPTPQYVDWLKSKRYTKDLPSHYANTTPIEAWPEALTQMVLRRPLKHPRYTDKTSPFVDATIRMLLKQVMREDVDEGVLDWARYQLRKRDIMARDLPKLLSAIAKAKAVHLKSPRYAIEFMIGKSSRPDCQPLQLTFFEPHPDDGKMKPSGHSCVDDMVQTVTKLWKKWGSLNVVGMAESIEEMLTERSYTEKDIPTKFYLTTGRLGRLVDDLKDDTLDGVEGIAGDGRILASIASNGGMVVVMPGKATVNLNKLSRVMYENPEYWVQNDFSATKRVVNSVSAKDAAKKILRSAEERARKLGKFKVLTDIRDATWLKPEVNDESVWREHKRWEALVKFPSNVRNLAVFAKHMHRQAQAIWAEVTPADREGGYGKTRKAVADVSWQEWAEFIKLGTEALAFRFEIEGEWIVKNKKLKLPRGTIIRIKQGRDWSELENNLLPRIPKHYEVVPIPASDWNNHIIKLEKMTMDRWSSGIPNIDIPESITERSFVLSDIPKEFRVVFYLGSTERGGDATAWKSLAAGKLFGIRGISDQGAIEAQFLGVARDAVLVMPGKALAQENKLTRMLYGNIHYLLSNDMAAMKRIVQASSHPGRARAHAARVLMEYLLKVIKESNDARYRDLIHEWEYAGVGSGISNDFDDIGKVDSVRDFMGATLKIVDKRAADKKRGVSDRSHYFRIVGEQMHTWDYAHWLKLLSKVSEMTARIYGEEGEWVSKGDSIKIPTGSTLRLLTKRIPDSTWELYKKLYPSGGEFDFFDPAKGGTREESNLLRKYEHSLGHRAYVLERMRALGVLKRYRVEWIYDDDFEYERKKFWDTRQYSPPGGTGIRANESVIGGEVIASLPSVIESVRDLMGKYPHANVNKIAAFIDKNSRTRLNMHQVKQEVAAGGDWYFLHTVPVSAVRIDTHGDVNPDGREDLSRPIVVGAGNVVLDGRHRVALARQRGIRELSAWLPAQMLGENIHEGVNREAYHASDTRFAPGHSLDVGHEHYGEDYGIFVTPNKRRARMWGKYTHRVRVRMSNPLVVSWKGDIPETLGVDIHMPGGLITKKLADAIQRAGYDSVIYTDDGKNVDTANEFILFDKRQVKVIDVIGESITPEHRLADGAPIKTGGWLKLKQVKVPLNSVRKDVGESLDERRGDWLFHTTSAESARKILKDKEIRGYPFVSLSSTATWLGAVVFVFSKTRLRDRFMEVDYTHAWAEEHPAQASYIAGMPSIEYGSDKLSRESTIYKFGGHRSEKEWVSRTDDEFKLRPGDIDRILLVPTMIMDKEVMGYGVMMPTSAAAREILDKLPRHVAAKVGLMGDLKAAAKKSGLMKPDDVVWRDRGRVLKHREKQEIKGALKLASDKYGGLTTDGFIEQILDMLDPGYKLPPLHFSGKFGAGVPAGKSVTEARGGGSLWHLTDRKRFKPSDLARPITHGGTDRATSPMLYATRDPHYWTRVGAGGPAWASKRKWAAELELLPGHPPVARENPLRPQTVLDPRLVRVVRVIPTEAAIAETTGYLDNKWVGGDYVYGESVTEEKARDYRKEYDNYHAKPEQRANRSKRNQGRRKLGLKKGDAREVDHKRPLTKGGGNGKGNLRAVSFKTNRAKSDKTEGVRAESTTVSGYELKRWTKGDRPDGTVVAIQLQNGDIWYANGITFHAVLLMALESGGVVTKRETADAKHLFINKHGKLLEAVINKAESVLDEVKIPATASPGFKQLGVDTRSESTNVRSFNMSTEEFNDELLNALAGAPHFVKMRKSTTAFSTEDCCAACGKALKSKRIEVKLNDGSVMLGASCARYINQITEAAATASPGFRQLGVDTRAELGAAWDTWRDLPSWEKRGQSDWYSSPEAKEILGLSPVDRVPRWVKKLKRRDLNEAALTYYHGTSTALGMTSLQPASETGKQTEIRTQRRHRVFFTSNVVSAMTYARRAVNKWGGAPVVFRVEPNGSVKRLSSHGPPFGPVFHASSARIVGRENLNLKVNENVSRNELQQLERFLDAMFKQAGLDIEFTRHFFDRVNDSRNGEPITTEELAHIFQRVYTRYAKKIVGHGANWEAVIKDLTSQINIPFVLEYNRDTRMMELISKTVMRKRNFKTVGKVLTVQTEAEDESVVDESIEFRDAGKSPLTYHRGGLVHRLVLCDTSVTDPPNKGDVYFAEIERWRHRTKTGRRLKKPVLDEIIPGVKDNCIVAFLDWTDWTDTGRAIYYLNYMKSRSDSRGKGYIRKIIEEFYRLHPKAKMIHWGRMMHPAVGHLLDAMKKKYPKINSIGAINYDVTTEERAQRSGAVKVSLVKPKARLKET